MGSVLAERVGQGEVGGLEGGITHWGDGAWFCLYLSAEILTQYLLSHFCLFWQVWAEKVVLLPSL